jgi:SAM-dependent MidA family methyltransferase
MHFNTTLPQPTPDEMELSNHLKHLIKLKINDEGDISFHDYMEMALYHPQYGYYTSGIQTIGESGDFITAPEISPLFSQCIAVQYQQILEPYPESELIEIGAGSGKMCIDLLTVLEKMNALPSHYYILELSHLLRKNQKINIEKQIPHLAHKVQWLDKIENEFKGIIVANEVLDAMPVNLFKIENNHCLEAYVTHELDQLKLIHKKSSHNLQIVFNQLLKNGINFEEGYESEINCWAEPWLATLANNLQQGVILLIDYGHSQKEYYHPQRSLGTLMNYYRHHTHQNPLIYPGIQDITCHVNFTQIADSALKLGLNLSGYANQANFLINCGLLEMNNNQMDIKAQLEFASQIKKLTLPSEMGEKFKVMSLSKNIQLPLVGFQSQDIRHKL